MDIGKILFTLVTVFLRKIYIWTSSGDFSQAPVASVVVALPTLHESPADMICVRFTNLNRLLRNCHSIWIDNSNSEGSVIHLGMWLSLLDWFYFKGADILVFSEAWLNVMSVYGEGQGSLLKTKTAWSLIIDVLGS